MSGSRKPTLSDPNACKGFFPSDAEDDLAQVSLLVVVKPNGQVVSASVVAENPKGQKIRLVGVRVEKLLREDGPEQTAV